MFTSQSLRAVAPSDSPVFREHRLDDVVHQIEVCGALPEGAELSRRIDAALAGGVRWLILDLAEASRCCARRRTSGAPRNVRSSASPA
jgi:hypothetical protein